MASSSEPINLFGTVTRVANCSSEQFKAVCSSTILTGEPLKRFNLPPDILQADTQRTKDVCILLFGDREKRGAVAIRDRGVWLFQDTHYSWKTLLYLDLAFSVDAPTGELVISLPSD